MEHTNERTHTHTHTERVNPIFPSAISSTLLVGSTYLVFKLVFLRKTLVIKMMTVGGLGGWPGGRQHFVSATVGNILTKLVRIIEQASAKCTCANDNSAYFRCLIMFPDPDFCFISGLYLSHPLKYSNDTL